MGELFPQIIKCVLNKEVANVIHISVKFAAQIIWEVVG